MKKQLKIYNLTKKDISSNYFHFTLKENLDKIFIKKIGFENESIL